MSSLPMFAPSIFACALLLFVSLSLQEYAVLNTCFILIYCYNADWRPSACRHFRNYQSLQEGGPIRFGRRDFQIPRESRQSDEEWNAHQRKDRNRHDTSRKTVGAPCEKKGRLEWQRFDQPKEDIDIFKDACVT